MTEPDELTIETRDATTIQDAQAGIRREVVTGIEPPNRHPPCHRCGTPTSDGFCLYCDGPPFRMQRRP